MDPCTQGLLGAAFASSVANKKNLKVAMISGLIAGMTPDLDILIKSSEDTLLSIQYHRHFTHSLFVTPILSLLVSVFLYIFFKRILNFKKLYLFTFLGILSHGLLDSLTSYGTSLFWPFSNNRISLNVLSIIDPVYSLIILIFILISYFRKSIFFTRLGLIISSLYIVLNFIKYEQVKNFVEKNVIDRGHKVERILLNPTIGNNVLWRSIYQYKNNYYVDAIYMPIFSDSKIKKGSIVKVINKETIYPELGESSQQRKDIRRFSFFSQEYIYEHPDYNNVIADLRYGKLPYDDKSLWGIKIDIVNKEKHAKFISLRNFQKKDYFEFWELLMGRLHGEKKEIFNMKTYSGPMGMGLAKSYNTMEQKFCFYNTVNGQEKIISNDINFKCPKKKE